MSGTQRILRVMFGFVALTLGDAFNRRKKLAADLQNWIARLGLAGTERRSYRTAALDGDHAYQPDPGTEKVSARQYTVEECRERIAAILEEDQQLALRISRTNQQARAQIEDLDGRVRTFSILMGLMFNAPAGVPSGVPAIVVGAAALMPGV